MKDIYMKEAISLAQFGAGRVHPNPLVGAVVVKINQIIGKGYHVACGGPHAEVNAIKNATQNVKGATLYVTLEPCCHYGKTGPCTDFIIKSGIHTVVIGMKDPNPLVAGKGIKKLKYAGIKVICGVLEDECQYQNRVFFHYITHKTPWVLLKTAMSLDGKIATQKGESKWITGDMAREEVHRIRNQLTGIMVGVNTVIKDNPELTCRIANGRNPIRIVVDSSLRTPLRAKVFKNQEENQTIIATTLMASKLRVKLIEDLGLKVIICEEKNGHVDLTDLMVKLGEMDIDSILLEGGSTLNGAMLTEDLIHEVVSYISPQLIGGALAPMPIAGEGISSLSDAHRLNHLQVSIAGRDIKISGIIIRKEES